MIADWVALEDESMSEEEEEDEDDDDGEGGDNSVKLKSMNCSNFQRLYPATSLPAPHLPKSSCKLKYIGR